MRNKVNNEVEVSYKSLGDFVRQRRRSLGYTSIDSFAVANGIDRTYIVRLENGNQFGSPENFVAVAKALGVTPGYMMDIFAELEDTNNDPVSFNNSFRIPENFTDEDKRLLNEFISFLNYKKVLEQNSRLLSATNKTDLPASYLAAADAIGHELADKAKKKKVEPDNKENDETDEENIQKS